MRNNFLAAIVLLVSVIGMQCTAANVSPFSIDFYNLFNKLGFRKRRTTRDRIAIHGYPVEQHHVITEDGYILGIFRIPYSHKLQNHNQFRPIVLIQHGLMGGSDALLYVGPNNGLPYLLADAGFDVWLGNGRGNTYSRKHTSRSTADPEFWNFSWHEIGYYDVAAVIDYALKTNGQGQKSIHYVGHSQGTTVFFTLMSLRPEYNEKIKTAHMFAPIAIITHMQNKLVRALSPFLGHVNIFSSFFSKHEFLPFNSYLLTLASNCSETLLRLICVSIIKIVYDTSRWNLTALTEGFGEQPAGCSTNQILHYLQEQQSGHFRQYDYGSKKNWDVYKSDQPPDYPVENITSNVHLWFSDNDNMAAVEDVLALSDRLPNKELHHIENPKWGHDDFALSMDLRKYVNEPVIKIIQNFERANNVTG